MRSLINQVKYTMPTMEPGQELGDTQLVQMEQAIVGSLHAYRHMIRTLGNTETLPEKIAGRVNTLGKILGEFDFFDSEEYDEANEETPTDEMPALTHEDPMKANGKKKKKK